MDSVHGLVGLKLPALQGLHGLGGPLSGLFRRLEVGGDQDGFAAPLEALLAH